MFVKYQFYFILNVYSPRVEASLPFFILSWAGSHISSRSNTPRQSNTGPLSTKIDTES